MADRYWVGGAGTWDATTTTNWSATSGGAGGASAPTSADNVIFDTLSNATAYAVTVGTNANALDITIAGPAVGNVTITSGATAVINCYGSWTSAATGVVFTTTSGAIINFLATTTGKTITTNNVTLGAMAVTLNGVGGEWSLGSAFTITANFTVTSGTFTTSASNYALNVLRLLSSSVNVRSILFNASVITVSGPTAVDFTTATNLTFNAGTSTLIGTNSSSTLAGGAQTFYNVTFSSDAGGGTTISGANTFNNLTQTSRSATGIRTVQFTASQTINGTLTLGAANTSIRRILVYGTAITGVGVGTPITLTVATIATLADVNFRDIVAAGASGTWSGTRLGNGGGNSNITFDAGVNKYWNLAAGGVWSATAWALTSGGAVDTNNLPLAQDTVIIEDTGLTAGNTITIDTNWWFPTIDASTRTTAFTLASGIQSVLLFGNFNIPSVTTITGTGVWFFGAINATQDITTNGVSLTFPITIIGSTTNTVKLLGNLTLTNTVTLTQGTLDLNNNVLSSTTFAAGAGTNALAFGTGNITLTGTSTIFTGSTTTTVTGTPQVICTDSSATARVITPSIVTEANSISFRITAGTGTFSISSGNTVKDLDFTDGVNPTGFSGALGTGLNTIYGNFKASTGMTQLVTASAITFAATSGTKTINTAGVTFNRPFTFDGVGGTWQLQTALTSGATRACTLTNGTLDLASYTLTTGIFSSSNSNTRTLAFGTGKIVLTGLNTTVWATATSTGLTMTGTRTVELTGVGLGGENRTVSSGGTSTGGTSANAANFYIKAGADIISLGTATRVYGTLDFTGFSGTTGSNISPIIYGDLVLSTGMTVTGGTGVWTFAATTSQTITTNSVTINNPITFDGVGGTWSCVDALTLGSTRTLTMTNGTLKLKSGTTSTVGAFATSGTNPKYLYATTFGSQATISDASGTNTVDYLTIQDSNATGGAIFDALAITNVDAGNNTGWLFSTTPSIGNEITMRLRSFTQPRRF